MHPDQTLAEYLQTWLENYAKPNVGNKTYESYKRIVDLNITPNLGQVKLAELRPLQIQTFYSELMRSGRKKGGGLSPLTVQHVHRLLRKALHQAVRWEILDRNPADGADAPRVPRKEMHALDRDGLSRLLAALRGNKLYLPVLVAATTGMRRGEILALRWRDVEIDAKSLRVARSLQQISTGLEFKEPKSLRGRRSIALAQVTVAELKALKDARHPKPDDLVVCRPDGTPWPPDQLSVEFHVFIKRTGFAIRFHDLRHTHASNLLRDGVPVNVVSQRLGHAEPAITLNVYSHVLPGMQEEAAAKVDEMMAEVLAS
ncbi:MAG: site-specific integrase [Actinobacteria bacterium]|nr:MAG: site-specific integrase [Actinomycetota bacterium]